MPCMHKEPRVRFMLGSFGDIAGAMCSLIQAIEKEKCWN